MVIAPAFKPNIMILRSFTLNIAGQQYTIKKVLINRDNRFFQNDVEITKQAYLALENEFERIHGK